mgnify:CR=1 FL=1
MPAYWVARAKVNNPGEYKREEPQKFDRHIVIEFATLEDAVACHESPEYQAARKFRLNGVGENELIIVEGGDATT